MSAAEELIRALNEREIEAEPLDREEVMKSYENCVDCCDCADCSCDCKC